MDGGNWLNAALGVGAMLYGVVVVDVLIWRIGLYRFNEHNLLRLCCRCAMAPLWPMSLVIGLHKAIKRYMRERFKSELHEMWPSRRPAPTPAKIEVRELGESGPRYEPGQWVN